jgi:hypothetical protein
LIIFFVKICFFYDIVFEQIFSQNIDSNLTLCAEIMFFEDFYRPNSNESFRFRMGLPQLSLGVSSLAKLPTTFLSNKHGFAQNFFFQTFSAWVRVG